MDISFELSDRYYEELGPWSLRLGQSARAQLYAHRDHSLAQHGGRVLLPDLALAPAEAPVGARRSGPLGTAVCGLVGELRRHRGEGPERRDTATIRLECGAPICLEIQARRWDHVDVAPAHPAPGLEAWRMARPLRVADLLSGVLELQEVAFETGGVSSFPLLDDRAPNYPVTGPVVRLERLDLDPASPTFGALVEVEEPPGTLYWPHRYMVTLAVS
ncbi:MAG TPA: hypothetical protein VN837_13925 [Chloroflexota bacterium]|nr:hypothetical protein [Chloroflexota bacterium]